LLGLKSLIVYLIGRVSTCLSLSVLRNFPSDSIDLAVIIGLPLAPTILGTLFFRDNKDRVIFRRKIQKTLGFSTALSGLKMTDNCIHAIALKSALRFASATMESPWRDNL